VIYSLSRELYSTELLSANRDSLAPAHSNAPGSLLSSSVCIACSEKYSAHFWCAKGSWLNIVGFEIKR
jgi:hypothetical protein